MIVDHDGGRPVVKGLELKQAPGSVPTVSGQCLVCGAYRVGLYFALEGIAQGLCWECGVEYQLVDTQDIRNKIVNGGAQP